MSETLAVPRTIPFWLIASASLLVLSGVLSFPGALGLSRTAPVAPVENPDGYLLVAKTPPTLTRERKRDILFPDSPVVYEDGIALTRPDSSDKKITNAGRGRYQFRGSQILFSTSDGEPRANRIYTASAPLWSIRESLLLAVWLLALVASAIALRLIFPGGMAGAFEKPGVRIVSIALSMMLVAGFVCFRSLLSDCFFLGLLFPSVWAVLMAALSMQKHAASRATLLLLSLTPAVAGYIYYGLNAASDSSFLAGGIIPCSDARIHFIQAAEIAIQGTTQQMFNGRFLYPAFYAVILDLAGLNILIANLLVSSLVMVGLALTCRPVSRRVGFAGTAIYCLLFWLYFRAHGCGLLMTENLGLLLGVIGFGFLLLSVDQKTLWPVFASILFIGLGSVARPGALFVLPALALYAGIRAWMIRPTGRFRIAASAVLLGLAITGGCFGANHIVMKSLSRGEAKTFGNFAFTLHGLLNDTKWSTSAEEFGWNTSLVMEHNIRQIQETPMCLVRGITRAYGETFKKGFLFRFGQERRFASTGMAMFLLAAGGCWFWKPLRGDSVWILLAVAAILASIPFAPPWDAGERPYAATEPIQIFLAAAGASMLLDLLRRLASLVVPGGQHQICEESNTQSGLIGFAALCFMLTIPIPFLLKATGYRSTVPPQSPALLSGSRLLISNATPAGNGSLSRNQYLDRLSDFRAAYPAEARFFDSEPGDFLLAINWNNLEPVVLPVKSSSGKGE